MSKNKSEDVTIFEAKLHTQPTTTFAVKPVKLREMSVILQFKVPDFDHLNNYWRSVCKDVLYQLDNAKLEMFWLCFWSAMSLQSHNMVSF